jgi:hypothetical protein
MGRALRSGNVPVMKKRQLRDLTHLDRLEMLAVEL